MKDKTARLCIPFPPRAFSLSLSLALALLGALGPQQFAINLGYLFDVILQLVVVLDPATDFRHFLHGNDSAGRAATSQSNGQIPDRPMPFTFGAPAGGISAGHLSRHQRTAQNLGHEREPSRQDLAAAA